MENIDDFRDFLRKEAEDLQVKIDLVETKMSNLLLKQGVNSLDKLNKLNRESELLHGQMSKLYELIGKIR